MLLRIRVCEQSFDRCMYVKDIDSPMLIKRLTSQINLPRTVLVLDYSSRIITVILYVWIDFMVLNTFISIGLNGIVSRGIWCFYAAFFTLD